MRKGEITVSVNVEIADAMKALDVVVSKIDELIEKANQLNAITADLPKDSEMNIDELIERLRKSIRDTVQGC